MTEVEWLSDKEIAISLRLGRCNLSPRKRRLFFCACCRQVWHRLTDERIRWAVDQIERNHEARQAISEMHAAVLNLASISTNAESAANYIAVRDAVLGTGKGQVALLRDIAGNPFRPVSVVPYWQAPDVLTLAQATYEERLLPSGELDTVRLRVLADALEEAGCVESSVLDHCRDPGPHVRGCWALDLLLNKE